MQTQIANHTVELPDLHDAHDNALPVVFARSAIESVSGFHAQKVAIEGDSHLSAAGKAARIGPLASKVMTEVFHSFEALESERDHWARRESELLSVGAPASANEVQRDAEIRNWWAGLPAKQKAETLRDAEADPALGEFVRAVLRSPIPAKLDQAKQHLQSLHDRIRRLENPAEAHAIAVGKDLLAWGEQALTHTLAIARSTTGKAPEEMARIAIEAGRERVAVKLFGIPMVEKTKAILAAEQRRKSA